ncbi:hypothetical protein LCGC14_1248100 [marine sediment metagenome]|uniref:Uncharacterized protein n=1 Tax=marine sediment metagenome TaxID=412755 RepID=A0A0F9LQV1_9ZZZZ
MVVAPLTNIFFPSEEDRSLMVAAVATVASAGGTSVATITIPDAYPPINSNLPSPIIAIIILQADATLTASGNEFMTIADQCDGVPDSAKEFQITGARTIDYYQTPAEIQSVLVFYIAEGSGQVS